MDLHTRFAVAGRNIVIVKPRASVTEPNILIKSDWNVSLEAVDTIPEEAAVCKFCFNTSEPENMFKTICNCTSALAHEECGLNWSEAKGNNKCDVCEQLVHNFPVDWHLVYTISRAEAQDRRKLSLSSQLKWYYPHLHVLSSLQGNQK